MNAEIFNIQQVSFVDGPGIRTTVFFKGCNLRCAWCHNPESQCMTRQLLVHKEKCVGCGKCEQICPHQLQTCDGCGTCVSACLHDARELCGKEMSAEEVFTQIVKDRVFYETSGGGVTFSGGECMLQIDCLSEILQMCKKSGIHTAVDTAGDVPWTYFERVLPYTDLFLYDLKTMDCEIHKEYTGVGNVRILDNLAKLLQAKNPLWVRVPIIPGVNDTEQEMKKIKAFFEENGYPEKTQLLPYHKMGEHKYERLGKSGRTFTVPTKEQMEKLRKILSANGRFLGIW